MVTSVVMSEAMYPAVWSGSNPRSDGSRSGTNTVLPARGCGYESHALRHAFHWPADDARQADDFAAIRHGCEGREEIAVELRDAAVSAKRIGNQRQRAKSFLRWRWHHAKRPAAQSARTRVTIGPHPLAHGCGESGLRALDQYVG